MAINEQYIDNIAQEQLLSDEEERQLADRIKVGDARALEQLTKANLRFVVSLAHHYRGHGLDEDDLVSEGNIALMHAAAQFDGSRGVRFVVFAAPFIRQAMERAIEEQNVLEDTSRKATRRGERTAPRPLSLDQSIPVGSNSTFTLHSIIEDANAIPIDGGLDRGVVREQLLEGLGRGDDLLRLAGRNERHLQRFDLLRAALTVLLGFVSGGVLAAAAGQQAEAHDQREQKCKTSFHCAFLHNVSFAFLRRIPRRSR